MAGIGSAATILCAVLAVAACTGVQHAGHGSSAHLAPQHEVDAPLLEFRLAYTERAPGLEPMAHDGDTLFVEPTSLASDPDFVLIRPVRHPDSSGQVLIHFECSPGASRRMLQATARHVGRPVAILWRSELRSAPVVRDAVGCTPRATLGLDAHDEAEATRIVETILAKWPEDPV